MSSQGQIGAAKSRVDSARSGLARPSFAPAGRPLGRAWSGPARPGPAAARLNHASFLQCETNTKPIRNQYETQYETQCETSRDMYFTSICIFSMHGRF